MVLHFNILPPSIAFLFPPVKPCAHDPCSSPIQYRQRTSQDTIKVYRSTGFVTKRLNASVRLAHDVTSSKCLGVRWKSCGHSWI